jgi:glucosamine 6-phosphate synthetase-like amidotransferase/phosphosugar isomerase protein
MRLRKLEHRGYDSAQGFRSSKTAARNPAKTIAVE